MGHRKGQGCAKMGGGRATLVLLTVWSLDSCKQQYYDSPLHKLHLLPEEVLVLGTPFAIE